MTLGSDSRPASDADAARRRLVWRLGTPLVVLLSGTLFAVSAEQSDGTDLRTGRYTDLASVVRAEREETNQITAEAARLNDEIERLSAGLGDRDVNRVQGEVEQLGDPAGLTPKSGPAVQVTLTDAPPEVLDTSTVNPNILVVHQQDIQAVVNAMWRAGAEAVTVQGQRLVSTTGIKSEGNSVTLHGVPYSPPYEIAAVGDQTAILASLEDDSYLDVYREAVAAPGGGVGYAVATVPRLTAPAYDGLLDLTWASPMPTTQSG
jgi:uncharacterized protein YlxW (UPF0749 family)